MRYVIDTVELRKEMLDAGYKTITSFSDAAGVNRMTMGKILLGRARPSAEVMDKIVATLNLDPDRAGRIFFASTLRGA